MYDALMRQVKLASSCELLMLIQLMVKGLVSCEGLLADSHLLAMQFYHKLLIMLLLILFRLLECFGATVWVT